MKKEKVKNENLGGAAQRNDNCTMGPKITGTREWAATNFNFIDGCSNSCKYCFARAMAARHKRISPSQWPEMRFRASAVDKPVAKKDRMIMVPSSHDIVPELLPQSIQILERLLKVGNHLLIVSKPHLKCVMEMCSALNQYKDQILFRFSIGSADNSVLKFWEPNAPCFEERLESLIWAFSQGYNTSISCEPMLDANIIDVVDAVKPYVTDSIWIGKANMLKSYLSLNGFKDGETQAKAEELLKWQCDDRLIDLFHRLKDEPKIQWKDSFKKVLKEHKIEIPCRLTDKKAA